MSPGCSLEGLMLKLKFLGHLMWRNDSLEKTLMLEKIEGQREGDDRGWDGWMAAPTQWTWVWGSSGSWWWTGKPGMLLPMGSQNRTWLSDWTELKRGNTVHVYQLFTGSVVFSFISRFPSFPLISFPPEILRFLLELVCWALVSLLLSEDVFVSPSPVGTEFRAEGKDFFPFRDLYRLFHCLLASMDSGGKSAVIPVIASLHVMRHFTLAAFGTFFSVFGFQQSE